MKWLSAGSAASASVGGGGGGGAGEPAPPMQLHHPANGHIPVVSFFNTFFFFYSFQLAFLNFSSKKAQTFKFFQTPLYVF